MASKVLWNRKPTFNNGEPQELYENLNILKLKDPPSHVYNNTNGNSIFENGNDHHEKDSIVYDVPKSKPNQTKDQTVVDSLIPSAARLVLQQKQSSQTRSDILDDYEEALDFGEDYEDRTDFGDESETESLSHCTSQPKQVVQLQEAYDYGLEVIHEETESQMSSSDSEGEFDSDSLPLKSQPKAKSWDLNDPIGIDVTDVSGIVEKMSPQMIGEMEEANDKEQFADEIVPKHIRISSYWDPDPILRRLYFIQEPKHFKQTPKEVMSGFLSILSGNRKKGTFWNAWKRKFYVLCGGKLNGFEKENCEELFQSINMVGGKVDFLDPVDFVGTDQSKAMANRIIGLDDAKGHYYVFQCGSASDALKWVAALQAETLPSAISHYAIPILPKPLSLFKDVILVDIGSTNIRAGVVTHQPTLPALFFPAVMSENSKGKVFYGGNVYYPENRKTAKISFPFECTSRMCQNNLNINAINGFLAQIFKELNVQPDKYRIILNLPRRVDNNCKKNILELLFKKFQVKSALLCHQSVVSFWAYSSENGIVCDIGERCDIVPVSQGFVLSHSWNRAPFGGNPLKHSLRQGLGPQENGLYLSTPAENLVLRYISENFVYISSLNSRKISQDAQEVVVEMDLRDVLSIPTLIGVNQNVLRGVGEGFFDPGHYGLDCESLPKLLHKSLLDCGMDIRKEMSQNILVTGGCTLIPGFVERLEQELTKLCPPHLKPKIQASPYRYHASFIGASVLASTDAFEKSLIHCSKYDGGPGPSHWLV